MSGSSRRVLIWGGGGHGKVVADVVRAAGCMVAGYVEDALGLRPAIERLPVQPGDVQRTFADVSKARALLGYVPSTTVEEGIPRFVEWFVRQRAGRA